MPESEARPSPVHEPIIDKLSKEADNSPRHHPSPSTNNSCNEVVEGRRLDEPEDQADDQPADRRARQTGCENCRGY